MLGGERTDLLLLILGPKEPGRLRDPERDLEATFLARATTFLRLAAAL